MRLLLCLNNDFLANYALELVWDDIRHHQISIALSACIASPTTPRAAAFAQWGQREQALLKPHGGRYRSIGQLAASMGGEAPAFSSINSPEAMEYIKAAEPDLILSLRFGHVFKPPMIAIPRLGIINLHSGILPQYRGIYVPFWAMLNQEREIGCTLHYVPDAGIDKGDVIEECRMQADYSRSMMWNTAMMYRDAMRMIPRALNLIERDGKAHAAPQSTEGAGYCRFPQDEDIARFEQQGGRLYEEGDYAALFEPYGVDAACLQTA